MVFSNQLNRVKGLCKQTVLRTAGGTFVAIASLLVVSGYAIPAYAVTTYELPAPLSEQVVDFPSSGSGSSATPSYGFLYRIPSGTQFDRIQMSVPSSQTSYGKDLYVYIKNKTGSTWFYDDLNGNSWVTGETDITSFTTSSDSNPVAGTIQWTLGTTTTITSDTQYLKILLDPNSPYEDFSYNATPNYDFGASINGANYVKSYSVPTIKFCNGTCDSDNFSPIPNLTSSPWGRLISPSSGSTVVAGTSVPLRFQVNTGTSTADNVQIRFSSTIQSVAPYDYTLTSTGLNEFTYNFNTSAVDDYIQLVVDVRSGTSTVYLSTTYALNVRTSASGVGVNPQESQTCDDTSGLSWAICSTVAFLFIPSEASVDSFMSAYSELGTKMPFVYIAQASDLLTGMFTGTPADVPTVAVTTGIGTITFISQPMIEAIPFVDLIRSLIAAGLWLMLFVVLYRKTLTIHDKQTV